MKKLLVAIALVVLPNGAFAADLPQSGAAAPSPGLANQAFAWSGFYVGAHAGHMRGDVDVDYGGVPGGGDMDGFVGGALAGYNWQSGSVVYGLEADAGLGSVDGTGGGAPPSSDPAPDYSYDLKWNAHLRGRLGWAVDRTLFFAAGGLAVARHELGEFENGSVDHAHSGTHYGLSIGAGMEHAWLNNLVTRIEYVHDTYGRETYDAEDGILVKLGGHTARAALVWKY